ncbi:MAG: hypothetical protein EA382_10825 [Spirochaetaceae bacterium]|nr:MAG: hypothetical protein EA382_10825 [Spirochaetaceae bacterium]
MAVQITEVFYPLARAEWRRWLETHHRSKREIWLRRFSKATGEPSITYDELVEECLCFGWIDGVVKRYDAQSNVRRITPRRAKSFLSELNRQRVWKLMAAGLMTPAGLAALGDQIGSPDDSWQLPEWIGAQLRADPHVWAQFNTFPPLYRRLKIGWINEAGQLRQEEMQKRLDYLIRNTRKGKMHGTVPFTNPDRGSEAARG